MRKRYPFQIAAGNVQEIACSASNLFYVIDADQPTVSISLDDGDFIPQEARTGNIEPKAFTRVVLRNDGAATITGVLQIGTSQFLEGRLQDKVTSVSVDNFPADQTVNGTVAVSNLPADQTVNGTVAVSNLPADQTVNGTVAVSNLPADQTVNGAVNATTVKPMGATNAIAEPGAVGVQQVIAPAAGSRRISHMVIRADADCYVHVGSAAPAGWNTLANVIVSLKAGETFNLFEPMTLVAGDGLFLGASGVGPRLSVHYD